MKCEIDFDENTILLDGWYEITFERIQEELDAGSDYTWLIHMAEKTWVDLPVLFDAYCQAIDSLGIKISQRIINDFQRALRKRMDDQFHLGVQMVWTKRYGVKDSPFKGFLDPSDYRTVEEYKKDLVAGSTTAKKFTPNPMARH